MHNAAITAITLGNYENVISDDFKLTPTFSNYIDSDGFTLTPTPTFSNYFESAVGKLAIADIKMVLMLVFKNERIM